MVSGVYLGPCIYMSLALMDRYGSIRVLQSTHFTMGVLLNNANQFCLKETVLFIWVKPFTFTSTQLKQTINYTYTMMINNEEY